MNIEKDSTKAIDVPFYSLDIILSATDKFSDANKLGRGGFGPVYKGKFPGGQEMEVKRLSICSGQGVKELQNEVVLISKLQHRNLVRLLGYSLNKHEKILLYEYMPNRSLDAFIFDEENRLLLDSKKRFEIILGIARGLLYLHQDSRLRVIHKDLKTSNILCNENMNPKISDFGLARIVEGTGAEASTNNVVGTLGYMSPEYALEGKFSTKSNVFSFGVVLLEIFSGKENTGFYNPEQVLNLLRHAWTLWTENKALDLTDPTLVETCDESQVIECVNIGLLCIQEDPGERPTMSNVVVLLDSETSSPLPTPTQPAFVARRRQSVASSSLSLKPADSISNNELTISMDQGR
ncbi:G-type lectin S-receptor-like serine/threonine-protein kinase At4g03230 [Henckelia pumila]|uniref:G-type lectin S-receptor-like serine/threonine-protein kinase At4g03230 n=1 Tax=Henckelia pumila TaxID=405737 RepID=UPI003C6E3D89